MCTREREFTIRGTEDCLARGFDRSGFFEVDTGEQKSWTIQLTETNRARGTAYDETRAARQDSRNPRDRLPTTPR